MPQPQPVRLLIYTAAVIYCRSQTPFKYCVYSSVNINLDKEQQAAHYTIKPPVAKLVSENHKLGTAKLSLPYIRQLSQWCLQCCPTSTNSQKLYSICLCLLSVNVYDRVTIEYRAHQSKGCKLTQEGMGSWWNARRSSTTLTPWAASSGERKTDSIVQTVGFLLMFCMK